MKRGKTVGSNDIHVEVVMEVSREVDVVFD